MSEVIRGGAQAQTEATSETPKFTPGPWLVETFSDEYFAATNHKHRVASLNKPTYWIASVEGLGQPSLSDACLIASVPDLYEALKDVHALICEGTDHGFNPMVGDWAERLFTSNGKTSAALRKAEGAE